MKYAVDRIGGNIAVLIGEDESKLCVAVSCLPEGSREGSVLYHLPNGAFTAAPEEEHTRRKRLFVLQQRLRKARKRGNKNR